MVRKLGWEKISPKLVACMREGILKDGADGESRTPTGCPIRPSSARVYQFHHIGILIIKKLFFGCWRGLLCCFFRPLNDGIRIFIGGNNAQT